MEMLTWPIHYPSRRSSRCTQTWVVSGHWALRQLWKLRPPPLQYCPHHCQIVVQLTMRLAFVDLLCRCSWVSQALHRAALSLLHLTPTGCRATKNRSHPMRPTLACHRILRRYCRSMKRRWKLSRQHPPFPATTLRRRMCPTTFWSWVRTLRWSHGRCSSCRMRWRTLPVFVCNSTRRSARKWWHWSTVTTGSGKYPSTNIAASQIIDLLVLRSVVSSGLSKWLRGLTITVNRLQCLLGWWLSPAWVQLEVWTMEGAFFQLH